MSRPDRASIKSRRDSLVAAIALQVERVGSGCFSLGFGEMDDPPEDKWEEFARMAIAMNDPGRAPAPFTPQTLVGAIRELCALRGWLCGAADPRTYTIWVLDPVCRRCGGNGQLVEWPHLAAESVADPSSVVTCQRAICPECKGSGAANNRVK